MSKLQIEAKINNLARQAEAFLENGDKLERQLSVNDALSSRGKVDLLNSFKDQFTDDFKSGLESFIDAFDKFQREMDLQYELDQSAYKPTLDSEETLFYYRKADYAKKLNTFPSAEMLFKEYERLLTLQDFERVAMFETEAPTIMHNKGSHSDYHKLTTQIQRNQEKRVTQATKDNLEFLKDKGSFRRLAERLISELQLGTVGGSTLFSWLSLADITVSAAEIADTLARMKNMVDQVGREVGALK